MDRLAMMWATAVRAMDAQHQTSSWVRLGLVAILWVSVPGVADEDRTRVALQLIPMTIGSVLAYIHPRPALVDRLPYRFGLGALAAHLTSTRGRTKIDIPGLFEGFGLVAAAMAYAGPWAAQGLSVDARIVAMVAVTVFGWSIFVNVELDPGYYAPRNTVRIGGEVSSGPPTSILIMLRYLFPPIVALAAGALFVPAWTPELAAVPAALRWILAASYLGLSLVKICFDQVLEAAAATVADAENLVRRAAAEDLHSWSKNSVSSILNAVESPYLEWAEVRGLARDTLSRIEQMRREWVRFDRTSDLRPLEELWEATLTVLPRFQRERCTMDKESLGLRLGSTDLQLVGRLLIDLVINALKAGAEHVAVAVRPISLKGQRGVEVTVRDDGPGMPDDVLDDPHTSLAILSWELSRYSGGLDFAPGPDRNGTVVRACWCSADISPQSTSSATASAEAASAGEGR
ncbi:hypothetical protein HII36_08380 [Nonomuraea sp. NN258]|uniref:ATP-binding protein n=1 Tax=Nonomuraea antri TaxID=2730852 RepID=UPI00156A0EE6|nr:ATP-binding protein [Nonomuraea antri]NRQ31855.1 hypothetical protein [Nonomuraea antri]